MIRHRKIVHEPIVKDSVASGTEETPSYTNIPLRRKHAGRRMFIIQTIIFLGGCLIIGRARGGFFNFFRSIQNIGTYVEHKTRAIMSASIGTAPTFDKDGNVNIALLGYGGGTHDGTYLTDAIIIASINPKKGTMSMLSIPRDLYVKKPLGNYGKINSLYEQSYYRYKKDMGMAAKDIMGKLTEISGIPISYYAFIDFAGFEKFIDSLGGIEIDVPDAIIDTSYPGENNSYITFSINSGTQILDGSTALKYARSRHSTSDFSRSMRQQAIIQAVMDKAFAAKTVLNPARAKEMYTNFTAFIKTNLSLSETLRALPYAGSLDHKASRQIAACGASNWQNAQAGCLLYTPPLEAFGGASVQVPNGASLGNVSNYTQIHQFVVDTVMNHDFIVERPQVRVLNGVSTGSTNKALRGKPLANSVAIDLIEDGFTVYDAKNADVPQTQTTITTNGPGRKATKQKLQALFPNITITEGPILPDGPSVIIVIGDDYTPVMKRATTAQITAPLPKPVPSATGTSTGTAPTAPSISGEIQ